MAASIPSTQVTIVDQHGKRLTATLSPGMSVAIIGTDGTGKSTAAEMLVARLREAGVPCTMHHWYRWYQAAIFMPLSVFWNRRRRHTVQIFDRTVFDNLATLASSRGWPLRSIGRAAGLLRFVAPRFDVFIFLVAAPEVIAERRPEVTPAHASRALATYDEIGRALGLLPLDLIAIAT